MALNRDIIVFEVIVLTDHKSTHRPLNAKLVISYILGYVLLYIVMIGVSIVSPIAPDDTEALMARMIPVTLIWYFLMTVFLSYIARRYLFINQWQYFTSNRMRSFIFIVLGGIALLAVVIIIQSILIFGLGIEVDPENQAQLENMMTSSVFGAVGVFTFAVIFAPIVEELVFRKGLFGLIQKRAGLWAAIIGNSFVFGLIHVIEDLIEDLSLWVNIFPYMAPGLVLSYVYYRSGKIIWIPIIIHVLYNAYGIIVTLINYHFL